MASGNPSYITVASASTPRRCYEEAWVQTSVWRKPATTPSFGCMIYFARAWLSLKRPKKSPNWVGGRKTIMWLFAKPKLHSVLWVFRTKSAAASSEVPGESVAQPCLRLSLAPGLGRGQGGAGDTAVTPSIAFAFFKSSEDDTCGKHSLKVEVQYSVSEADKQGSFVRTCDSCLLDFIGKCTKKQLLGCELFHFLMAWQFWQLLACYLSQTLLIS